MILNPEFVNHFQPSADMAQRANQERMQYIDGTCTYMCGAPIFEFGLWPYLPHLTVMGVSTTFLVLYKYSIQMDLPLVTAYLVLGMGFVLGLLIIVGLCVGASRNIEDFSRRKAQRKKQVLQVEGDENRRGYTVDQNLLPSDSTMRRRGGLVGEGGSQNSAIMIPVDSYDVEARGEVGEGEDVYNPENEGPADLSFSAHDYTQHQKKQYRAISRAATSKIVEASFMMAITFSWLLYGMLFSSFGRDLFPISVDIGLAIFAFGLTQTSYIQSWYDNIITRYLTFGLWGVALFMDPTDSGNVPSCEDVSLMLLLVRLAIFFTLYCLTEADTTAQINYWLRFCNRKKLIRNLPKLVSPPIEQIDTPGNRKIYAIQRIVFQSMYTLFLPCTVWPFALLHIVWLVYRIRTTIAENNEGMMKKYEDISISSMMNFSENPFSGISGNPEFPETPPSQDREFLVLEDPIPFTIYGSTNPVSQNPVSQNPERRRASPASAYPPPHCHLGRVPGSLGIPSPKVPSPKVPGQGGGGLLPPAPFREIRDPGISSQSVPVQGRECPERKTPEFGKEYPMNPPPPHPPSSFRPRGPPGRAPARRVRYIRIRGPPPRGATRVPRGFVPFHPGTPGAPGIPGRGVPSASVPRGLSRISGTSGRGRPPYTRFRENREVPSPKGPEFLPATLPPPPPAGKEELHLSDREEYPIMDGDV